jgi:FkbM family methyltransferase
MTRLRDRMNPLSRLRYLAWRSGMFGDDVTVRLATGERLLLQKSMPFALGVGHEIFVRNAYWPPREINPSSIRRIIDIGANVGFSIAYWAARFPDAQIEAIEPLPAHVAALRRIVSLNRCADRTTIHAAAVGVVAGFCEMTIAGDCSQFFRERHAQESGAQAHRVQVPVIDIFELIGSTHVDLLKIDCEGAEYEIMMDARFGALDVDNLVLEWHATEEHPEAERDIRGRLHELGWSVDAVADAGLEVAKGVGISGVGMFWGFRR